MTRLEKLFLTIWKITDNIVNYGLLWPETLVIYLNKKYKWEHPALGYKTT